jgi:hypothetical protein
MIVRMFLTAALFLALVLQTGNAAFAQDEALGRLFYTPAQRAALDANIRSVSKQARPAPAPPRSVTVNGIVTRSDGERTVWIDGRAYHRDDTAGMQIRVEPEDPAAVEIKVQGVPRRQSVRVGQRLDPATGQTLEAFETPQRNSVSSGAEPASTPDSKQ